MTASRPFLQPALAPAVAFVLAESADLLTWCAFAPRELNPLIVALGLRAVAAKLGLMAVVVALAWAIGRPWSVRVLMGGVACGILGAVSNLPIR